MKEKKLIPIKEELFQGEFTDKYDDEGYSAENWEDYRLKIFENRNKDRTIDDIIYILKANWELLAKALEKENIINIQCFMNLIFDGLNNMIKNSKGMKTPEERRKFENEFNDFINDVIQDYTHLSENYLKFANIYEGTSKDPVLGFPPNSDELYPYL